MVHPAAGPDETTLLVFDHSGHRALFEEPAHFSDVMT